MEGAGGLNKARYPDAEEAARRRAQECHECIFCKRGFTNAQALGGHMNIHRKEKERSGGVKEKERGGGAAAQHRGAGGSRPPPYVGNQVGLNEDVDLELRLWH